MHGRGRAHRFDSGVAADTNRRSGLGAGGGRAGAGSPTPPRTRRHVRGSRPAAPARPSARARARLRSSALTYVDSGRWMKRMKTPRSTCSTESCSTRYGPMRQYDSGGSSVWSLIHPLPGVCSSGWLRKKQKRPPGRTTRAISSIAPCTSSMCSNTRHATAASNDPSANGNSAAPARTYAGPPARSPATADLIPGRVDADRRPTRRPPSSG